MYYFLYKTTNLINNKFYIGVHFTKNLEDSYLGSGLLLKKAINKYGKENFKREILKFFTSKKETFNAELMIVNEKMVKAENCYNLRVGGHGGNTFEFMSKDRLKEISDKKRTGQLKRYEDPKQKEIVIKVHLGAKRSDLTKQRIKESQVKAWSNPELLLKHSNLIKEKMNTPAMRKKLSLAAKNRYSKSK